MAIVCWVAPIEPHSVYQLYMEGDEMGDEESTDEPEFDSSATTLFDALSHSRRQAVVLLLAGVGYESTLHELATLVAMLESGRDVSRTQTTNVRTSLKRSHLPVLETSGIVSVDRDHIITSSHFQTALRTMANGITPENHSAP